MERWAWAGAGAVAAVLALALVAGPLLFKATLPAVDTFVVINNSHSRVALLACADRCVTAMVLDPGQSWDASTVTPIRAIEVGGLGDRRCLMPPRGVSRPVFLVTRADSCPLIGVR